MAEPKRQAFVQILPDKTAMHVYSTDIDTDKEIISQIQGVSQVIHNVTCEVLTVYINPLYDIEEISEEIKTILLTEVPEVFRS